MIAAKEKTFSPSSESTFAWSPRGTYVQAAATSKHHQPSTTRSAEQVVSRFTLEKFRACKSKKSPIGSKVKSRPKSPWPNRRSPEKTLGETRLQLRQTHWAIEMSQYRAYFVPGTVDPSGRNTSDRIYDNSHSNCHKLCDRWAEIKMKGRFNGADRMRYYKECTRSCGSFNGLEKSPVCVLQVCCKPVGLIFRRAHCVVRFVHPHKTEGCRGGPTGTGSEGDNRQPSFCKGCCGIWGSVTTACGKGNASSDNPAESGLASDLDYAKGDFGCSYIEVSGKRCSSIQKCVAKQMKFINSKCYRYAPGANNSNATWRTALSNCLQGNEKLPDPRGFQPGNQFLEDKLGLANCK